MTWTTTPPSEPGWYWIKPKDADPHPCRFEEGHFSSSSWTVDSSRLLVHGYTFGPRIEPPRDDDEELATAEWLIAEGIPQFHWDKETSRFYFVVDGDAISLWFDNGSDEDARLCYNPTRRKVRQIVEALK